MPKIIKRFEIKKVNAKPLFIGAWTTEPISICDEIISFFDENTAKQTKGLTGDYLDKSVSTKRELSISSEKIAFSSHEMFKAYSNFLHCCYKDYLDQWPFLQALEQTAEANTFNIKRYNEGECFESMDAERDLKNLHRFFTFVTFLNDVERGGSIHFNHYDLDIQPQKGLTLIWPAGYTHAHSGNIVGRGIEYMITGWVDLVANHKKSK
ncbi:2OG-Fe(II) oxygenase [Prochlorococcus sp. MIT 1303]|uniref:2OG-Fe(II) oxygenase n=1 Tax=Prochlorococcus sp. MIT 1303 TaxID=1723647 RepID=UPI0007B346BB|nr:2OG-Fe(II) oxygenase [Prochlorococcus sp. MIT 1303]KZR69985.1 hypothetical protein PMIT1303_00032 [Prochlorococcus sp. MIT 1303]